jgi:lantibiotic modifying enzyme
MLSAGTTMYHSDLSNVLRKQIDSISNYILRYKTTITDPGLLSGKAGVTLLFAYLSELFPEKNYHNNTIEFVSDLADSLSNDELDYHLSTGVAGIAFVFQHLRNRKVLDRNQDLNLSVIDKLISYGIDRDFVNNNWDPLHGLVGLGIYFLERNKETREEIFLSKIIDHLLQMSVQHNEYNVWITQGHGKHCSDNYNFGMAHGMPGILSFLAQAHQRKIRQKETEGMITSCLSFILKYQNEESGSSFPGFIDTTLDSQNKITDSRLAWCYGDLCMANALVHCGRALKRNDWKRKGIEIAIKTTSRDMQSSQCSDACFCHGTVGVAHQYNRFYKLTGNKVFRCASEKWINITLEYFYQPGKGFAGYSFNYYNEETNAFDYAGRHGLLEGSAGIALVFLSHIYKIQTCWDSIFQTNV